MPEHDDRDGDHGAQNTRRRLEHVPQYGVLGPAEVERLVKDALSRFFTKDETTALIQAISGQRWWNAGMPVSDDPYKSGEPEQDARKLFAHLRTLAETEAARQSNPYRTMVAVASVLGGIAGFVGMILLLLSHIAWK